MYYLSTSCLIFFFLFSLFYHLPCASSIQERGFCETLFQCGNITAGYPFWGENRLKHCGHPLLELRCTENITSLFISNQEFNVFQLNQTSYTLTLARTDLLGSICSSRFTTTTLPPDIFELSPTYKSLTIFYFCANSIHKCPKRGYIIVSGNPDEYRNICGETFSVNVPKSFVVGEKEFNMTNLESVLSKGFEVKVKINDTSCQECSSSHGSCDFNETLPLGAKCSPLHPLPPTGHPTEIKAGIAVGASVLGLAMLILAGWFCLIRQRRMTQEAQYTSRDLPITKEVACLLCVINQQTKTSAALSQEYLKALIPLKQYSYVQVKKITKSFAKVIGKGGFGTVYRGTLTDGRSVAVKILKDSKGNGEDFINEVASMSKTSHVNIVSLLGFCSEGSKRAIIYEYLENGSLDQFISSNTSINVDWMALYGIALGVARGLDYLHHGCKTRIVHFDIKPQNILLDDNLCPKVSDFGLAKLCKKKESILSLLDTRGTIGYIAPEVFSRMYGRVSHKSDVYSYGMLLLEMIGARNKERFDQNSASNISSMYFPEWIYKDLEKGVSGKLIENGISSEDEEVTKKMTIVGLWCIQPFPSDRPEMNRVVEMMEGNLDALEVPPRPVSQDLPMPLQESSTFSEDISIYPEV